MQLYQAHRYVEADFLLLSTFAFAGQVYSLNW